MIVTTSEGRSGLFEKLELFRGGRPAQDPVAMWETAEAVHDATMFPCAELEQQEDGEELALGRGDATFQLRIQVDRSVLLGSALRMFQGHIEEHTFKEVELLIRTARQSCQTPLSRQIIVLKRLRPFSEHMA